MSNNSAVVAVIGLDQPGIVACVSAVLTRLGCNIEHMTQTALRRQFAGIYLISKPASLADDALRDDLARTAAERDLRLSFIIRPVETPTTSPGPSEPFVISVHGADRNDIIGSFSSVFWAHDINIESLRAFPLGESGSMQVFEVSVPLTVDPRALHRALQERARALGLSLTMQHRAIFEAVHRVETI